MPRRPSGKDAMPNNKYKATIQTTESSSGVAAGTSGYRMAHVAPSGKDAMMPNYSPTGSEDDAMLQAAKAVSENRSLEDRTQSEAKVFCCSGGC